MKMTAAAAIGALILAASAAPALAGGYWDGDIVQGGQAADPPRARGDRDCPCYCPRDRADYGARQDDRRVWNDQREDDSAWRDDSARYQDQDEEDYAPADYSDDGYGVGPEYVIDAGGGGSGFVGGGAFAGGGVDIEFNDRFRDHFDDHDRFRDHDHHMQPHMMRHDDHPPYPQHQGSQPHMGAWGHTGGYGHPAMHGGGRRR
jgi:hypothetical protein